MRDNVTYSLFGKYKYEDSIALLQQYEPKKGYYLAFSGGKDSVVLYDIATKAGVKFDAHFANTTVEAPETYQFIRHYYPHVKFEKPLMTMRKAIIQKQFPPTRKVRYCCEVLKECHGAGRLILTGVRKFESVKRSKRKQIEVDRKDYRKIFIHPLFFWETEEVWEYIKSNHLPVNPLYAEGRKRIGCVMCPMRGSEGMKLDAIRWPRALQGTTDVGLIKCMIIKQQLKAKVIGHGNPVIVYINGGLSSLKNQQKKKHVCWLLRDNNIL